MNHHLDGEQELIVVDNASDRSPGEAARGVEGRRPVRRAGRERRLRRRLERRRRRGRRARSTVLLNPDTELLDDGLDRLAADGARARRRSSGPRVLNADGSIQPSASGARGRRLALGAGAGPGGAAARRRSGRAPSPTGSSAGCEVTWLTGACIAAPDRRCCARLGPFDPALHMFGEDVDLGLRAARRRRRARASTRAPAGSSTTARARRRSSTARARAGARPATLNWRAAVRRAYGPRREWLGWRALRFNLRLRLVAKTLLGRATPSATAAARPRVGRPAPDLRDTARSPGRARSMAGLAELRLRVGRAVSNRLLQLATLSEGDLRRATRDYGLATFLK